MKKKQKSMVGTGVFIAVMVVAMVAYFFYLTNKEKARREAKVEITPVQEVIMRNLDTNYPPTPREVVRYYSEITKCLYNEEYTDEELEQLVGQMNRLYDWQLLEKNNNGDYMISLQSQIVDFNTKNLTISTYTVASSTDVDEYQVDDYSFARLHCIYTLRQNNYRQDLDQVFLLRKDEDGHWKIYGWANADDVKEEE